MEILVLNGSPRPRGNTVAMVRAFAEGAEAGGHRVTVIDVCKKDISGCLGCEHCHGKGRGTCIQRDDMQGVLAALSEADMVVFASPIYYFGLSGQLQCLIHRTYALGTPPRVRKTMLVLSSGSDDVFDAAVYEYERIAQYWGVRDAGVFTAYGRQNKSERILSQLMEAGRSV